MRRPECESLEIREVVQREPEPATRSRSGRRPFHFPSLRRRRCTAGGAWFAAISGRKKRSSRARDISFPKSRVRATIELPSSSP